MRQRDGRADSDLLDVRKTARRPKPRIASKLAERMRLARAVAGHGWRRVILGLTANPRFRWRIGLKIPERLLIAPQDLRTGDPTLASEFYSGRFVFAGKVVAADGLPAGTEEGDGNLFCSFVLGPEAVGDGPAAAGVLDVLVGGSGVNWHSGGGGCECGGRGVADSEESRNRLLC